MTLAVTVGAAEPAAEGDGGGRDWGAAQGREHPWVGRIWSRAAQGFVEPEALFEAADRAQWVLLGEKHDNPDHHRLQARVLKALVAADRRPAVLFEMIPESRQSALDAFLSSESPRAGALGEQVGWSERNWPDWPLYQPIAQVALAANLPILGANLARERVREIARFGFRKIERARRRRMGLHTHDHSSSAYKKLKDVLHAAHCAMIPRERLGPLVHAQKTRDAVMADNLISALGRGDGAVLIAGNGHVRTDLGVPAHLRRRRPEADTLTLGLLEVWPEKTSLSAYAAMFKADELPFDFVWWTPRVNDKDHCEQMRERMKQRKRGAD